MNSKKSWLAVGAVGLVTGAAVAWQATASGAGQTVAAAAGGTHVAVVDLVTVFNDYELTKTLNERMTDLETELRNEDQKRVAEIDALTKATGAFNPGTAERTKADKDLFQKKVEYQVWKGTKQEDVGQQHLAWVNVTYAYVEAEVAAIAKARGIQLVITREELDTSITDSKVMQKQIVGRKVIYSDPSVDITKEVLDNLNSNFAKKLGGPKAVIFNQPWVLKRP
jgi:Skp family chaperone for outer membrane proteins